MKVLQINSHYRYGSTGRIVQGIHEKLITLGHESFIEYGRGEVFDNSGVRKFSSNASVLLHVALTRLTDRHGSFSIMDTNKLINEIKKLSPDIIHLHNIHGYYLNIKRLFTYLSNLNRPVIWTLHDCWAFTGHCAYFDYSGCHKWTKQCYSCPELKSYPQSILLDSSKHNYKEKSRLFNSIGDLTIVTPSKWLSDLVEQSFLKNEKLVTIYNGIDLKQFTPREKFKSQIDKPQLLFVASRWDRRKGLSDVIELSRTLGDKYRYTIVGLSNQQSEQLPSGFKSIPRTNNISELATLYSSADVFVNCSHEDNLPTCIIEALACGTPVVAYDTGGSKEIVDRASGRIVDKGNIKRLANAVDEVTNMTKNPMEYVKRAKEFDKESKYSEYICLYENILGNR